MSRVPSLNRKISPQGGDNMTGTRREPMGAALELRDAGYEVQVLEYREMAVGRCWTRAA